MKFFYERNDKLLNHEVNKTFEEILWMSEQEFSQWVIDMRKAIVSIWDEDGIPPKMGITEEEIIEEFNKLEPFDTEHLLCIDEHTQERNIIRNTTYLGNCVNQWFPTMLKTKINYTSDVTKGLSIYDHFKEPHLLEKMTTYARRHYKRDSFYHYSQVVVALGDPDKFLFSSISGVEWIKKFESNRKSIESEYDYWLYPKEQGSEYSGYNEEIKERKFLTISKDQMNSLNIPEKCKTNVTYRETDEFLIRVYKKGQKIFPIGLLAFRVSVCQHAVNFPPLTAKFIYERCTNHLVQENRKILVWDPSAGWGGRLLGAMSVKDDRSIHYIGTDPNTDHNTPNGRTKYHEIADFYNTKTKRGSEGSLSFLNTPTNTYEIYQCGSEVIQYNKDFQKYKGKLDLVFTSPPYFSKELYSNDKEQSAIKFSTYNDWFCGFLIPTLETAVEWLRPGGLLVWNIADVKFDGEMLPLEEDSYKIIQRLQLEHIDTLKMVLARMPGGNRIDPDTGLPMAKNYCQLSSGFYKIEPCYIFRK